MHTAESLQRAFRYLFEDEVTALKDLARSLPDNPTVVNIGAGSGTSTLAFLESRLDLKVISVDIQYEDSPHGCIVAEMREVDKAGYPADRYFFIVGDSKQVGEAWQDDFFYAGLADCVFIDGDHSYRGAKGDILAWLPNIKEGGIMAVHDYGKREVYRNGPIDNAPHPLPWPGVDRAVRKFLCPYFEIVSHVETLISFRVTEEGRQKLNDYLAG